MGRFPPGDFLCRRSVKESDSRLHAISNNTDFLHYLFKEVALPRGNVSF